MHTNIITMCNCNTTTCNHSVTPHNITRYLTTMHHEEIEVDTEAQDEVEEYLDEVEVQ
jgi:hypothetical protein